MAKRFISFGSIEQFRSIIRDVTHNTNYIGLDKDGNPEYNKNQKMPVVTVTASEKIHGTNAAVCYNDVDGFWVQSRKNIITPEKDNAGCASFCYNDTISVDHETSKVDIHLSTKDAWMEIINQLADEHSIDLEAQTIAIYFEWAGGNIQKLSALTSLDKRAIIFQYFKVLPTDPIFDKEGQETLVDWLPTCYELDMFGNGPNDTTWVQDDKANIYNIMNFPVYKFDIDFNEPLMSQNEMIRIVEEIIEPNSPVGKEFDCDGNVGEGMVCTFEYKGKIYRFKVKGEKHSASKVKTLAPVDEEKEKIKNAFVIDHACKAWRLEQMYQEVFDTLNGGKGDEKRTGDFLRAVVKDVMKEESDILAEMGLEFSDVSKKIPKVARQWFAEQLDRESSL